MVEELPADLAMEIIRSAPGTFYEKLTRLPPALRPLAALAQCPGLAAACMLPSECAGTSSSLPNVDLCFDVQHSLKSAESRAADAVMRNADVARGVTATDTNTGGDSDSDSDSEAASIHTCRRVGEDGAVSSEERPSQSDAGERLWVAVEEVSESNVDDGLFTLQRRAGTVVCQLVARSCTLKDSAIFLPEGSCMVFRPGSSSVHMKGMKFQGVARHGALMHSLGHFCRECCGLAESNPRGHWSAVVCVYRWSCGMHGEGLPHTV